MKSIFKIIFLLISINIFAQGKETPIPVDKEDGFYSVIDYDTRKNELKDLKLSAKVEISTREILEIKRVKDQIDNNIIDITLTNIGAKKFKKLTKKNIAKPIAIVLDKKLVSAPIVLNVIPKGKIQINGNFTEEEIDKIIFEVKKNNVK